MEKTAHKGTPRSQKSPSYILFLSGRTAAFLDIPAGKDEEDKIPFKPLSKN